MLVFEIAVRASRECRGRAVAWKALAITAALAAGSSAASAAQRAPQKLTKSQAIQATIQALADNGSAKSRLTLKGLVSGTVDMKKYDRFAAVTALNEMAENADADYEAFLFRAVTDPDAIRPKGRGSYTAAQLRQDVAALLDKHGSESIRTSLATHLIGKPVADEVRAAVMSIVGKDSPLNVPAKAILYGSSQTDAKIRAAYRNLLLQTNRRAAVTLLGLPQIPTVAAGRRRNRRGTAAAPKPLDEQMAVISAAYNAKALWNDRFTDVLKGDMATDRLAYRVVVPFLASLPVSSARKELYELLKKSANGRPGAFSAERFTPGNLFTASQRFRFGSDWDDPAALLALKSVPHSQPPAVKPARVRKASPPSPKHEWFDAVAQLLSVWNDRAFAASAAADKAGRKAEDAKAAKWLIPPHAGAATVGWYQLKFPHQSQEYLKSLKIPQLQLEYYRTEGPADPVALRAHYQRALTGISKERPQRRNLDTILWLEGGVEALPTKRLRSVDILITRLSRTAGKKSEERVRVEVLVVDVPDYR